MTVRHPFNRTDIDLTGLREALSTRLGRRVELLTSRPVGDTPGELIVEDPDTGEHLDVDPAVVTEVVAEQRPPVSVDEQAIAEFDAASTVLEKLQVWRSWLARRVEADQQRRQRADLIRDRMVASRASPNTP